MEINRVYKSCKVRECVYTLKTTAFVMILDHFKCLLLYKATVLTDAGACPATEGSSAQTPALTFNVIVSLGMTLYPHCQSIVVNEPKATFEHIARAQYILWVYIVDKTKKK